MWLRNEVIERGEGFGNRLSQCYIYIMKFEVEAWEYYKFLL